MENFEYCTPTRVLFGKGQVEELPARLAAYGKKVLLTYGGGSIRKIGLYDKVKKLLDGFEIYELSGIEPNPKLQSVEEGAKMCKEKGVEVVLAVGGVSVLDCSKAICAAACYDGQAWDLITGKVPTKKALPLVTVLTLSATPIPRTLNMALSGLRDMSTIEEPPADRQPVQTYVLEHDWGILEDAMRKELARGGQIYYLHNRVETIDLTASRIQKLLGPEVRVVVGHGKMGEQELSAVMQAMVDGEADVLVCTTIIETGIDIPNVNTLIMEDADRLGLAQLHQIRGRIGRSTRRAYAYLTYRQGKILQETAAKRLAAIREYVEFGSGFKIAMRDLEIRGAGNLLGPEQSGYLMSVGYDLYLKLLEEAVLEERGEEKKIETECAADLTLNANISERYVASPEQRMDLYRRIAAIRTNDDASDLMDEMIDRYGEPPKSVLALLDVALLRAAAAKAGVSDITQKKDALRFTLAVFRPEALVQVCGLTKYKFRLTLSAGETPMLTLKLKPGADVLETALELVEDLKLATQALEKA